MSYQDGWSAFNLEMPDKVPRTEYSADFHYDLIKKVTGIDVNSKSERSFRKKAGVEFMKAWDYGFVWNILLNADTLNNCRTKMGHATYQQGGVDFNQELFCPFEDPDEAFDFNPMEVYGKINHRLWVRNFNNDYHKKVASMPDAVNTTGTYITLISGLLEIFGWDLLLMAMGIDAKAFGETANRYTQWMQQYFNALADSDVPLVMVHDDIVWTSGAFASPAWYREYVFPNYKKLFAPLREAGKKIIYTPL